jgi:Tfp pilus assembly protein PilF
VVKIIELVNELKYPLNVAQGLVQIVYNWKDEKGKPFIELWDEVLQLTKRRYTLGQMPAENLIKIEQIVIKNLGIMIKQEFESNEEEKFFDLEAVVKYKQAQCLSYTILIYILGTSLNFLVLPLGVTEIVVPGKLPVGAGHNACLFKLADNRMVMVDLAVGPIFSEPFNLEETYLKVGEYWEIKDNQNPLLLNRRFTILDKNGLMACVYTNIGKLSPPDEAIKYYDLALGLNPKYAETYSNKGFAYEESGQLSEAIFYYDQALEFNPKDARTYFNRGNAWMKSSNYSMAMLDYSSAIAHHLNFPEAYLNRGYIYSTLGSYEEAIFDYNKAIELNPIYAKAYLHRGTAFVFLELLSEAIADFTRAIEIIPDFADAYYNRGMVHIRLGEIAKAKEDFASVSLAPELKEKIEKVIKDIT